MRVAAAMRVADILLFMLEILSAAEELRRLNIPIRHVD